MELEPDRPRLDLANPGQEEPRQQRPVRQAVLQLRHRFLEDLVARGLLDPAHHRLDLGTEPDHLWTDLGLVCRGRGDRAKLSQLPRLAPSPSAPVDFRNCRRPDRSLIGAPP